MPDKTKVEWCDATINPFPGCSDVLLPDGSVSPACRECYAKRIAARMATNPKFDRYHGLALFQDGRPEWTGQIKLVQSELDKPRHWTRARTIFVESMGDVAHESLTPEQWEPFWALLLDNARREAPHTFYLLTKRPGHLRVLLEAMRALLVGVIQPMSGGNAEGARAYADRIYWDAMAWVVCMTTTEHQAAADHRVPELLRCPALHFGVSAEPLVGPLDLRRWLIHPPRLGWVIAGGWSGPHAVPSHPRWFRDLRDQAEIAGVPYFFKQWGEWAPSCPVHCADPHAAIHDAGHHDHHLAAVELSGHVPQQINDPQGDHCDYQPEPRAWWMARVGKREAGRLLDGVEHSAHPQVGVTRG